MSRGKRTHFFALREDLMTGLDRFEQLVKVKYAQDGYFAKLPSPVFSTWREIPDFGVSIHGKVASSGAGCVIQPAEIEVAYEVRSLSGKKMYTVGLAPAPHAFFCAFGGLYKDGTVVAGEAVSVDPTSRGDELYKLFIETVFRGFDRVRGNRVGPKAMELFKSGRRLTHDVSSARLCDLQQQE